MHRSVTTGNNTLLCVFESCKDPKILIRKINNWWIDDRLILQQSSILNHYFVYLKLSYVNYEYNSANCNVFISQFQKSMLQIQTIILKVPAFPTVATNSKRKFPHLNQDMYHLD